MQRGKRCKIQDRRNRTGSKTVPHDYTNN